MHQEPARGIEHRSPPLLSPSLCCALSLSCRSLAAETDERTSRRHKGVNPAAEGTFPGRQPGVGEGLRIRDTEANLWRVSATSRRIPSSLFRGGRARSQRRGAPPTLQVTEGFPRLSRWSAGRAERGFFVKWAGPRGWDGCKSERVERRAWGRGEGGFPRGPGAGIHGGEVGGPRVRERDVETGGVHRAPQRYPAW